MMRELLLSSLLVSAVSGQVIIVTVPPIGSPQNVDRPWPGGIGRYQQWYSAASLQANLPEPMRLQQIQFMAGTGLNSTPAMINCEILIGNGKFSGVTGQFDTNWDTAPIVAKPIGNVSLVAGTPGTAVITIPFNTLFTWDRFHPLLLEIRIYGNSLGNQPFNYNFQGGTASLGYTTRVYQGGSALAPTGTVAQGVGMLTRFQARPGMQLDFGVGCPGEGNVVPVHTSVEIPSPGIVWTQQLSSAASGRACLWVIGDSNTMASGVPLPIDISALFGLFPSGCMLRNNAVNLVGAVTVGGGAGGGLASLSFQLPGTTNYIGSSFYTQWVVFDPLSLSGFVSTTQGVWSIVAPVGG
ncbi:MAG TPA: hypothetical protein VFZ65_01820 [Planctomycetota bacterium]|nr:hypothetical protein [Planctomycetota bacterium]